MWYSRSMIPFHSHETPIDWVHTQYSTSTSLLQAKMAGKSAMWEDLRSLIVDFPANRPWLPKGSSWRYPQDKPWWITTRPTSKKLLYMNIHIYIYIHIYLKVIINQHAYAGHFKSITIIQTWMLVIHLDLYPSIQPQPPVVRRGVEHRNEA